VHVGRGVPATAFLHVLVGLPCVGDKLFESLGGLDLILEQPQHERMRTLSGSLGNAERRA